MTYSTGILRAAMLVARNPKAVITIVPLLSYEEQQLLTQAISSLPREVNLSEASKATAVAAITEITGRNPLGLPEILPNVNCGAECPFRPLDKESPIDIANALESRPALWSAMVLMHLEPNVARRVGQRIPSNRGSEISGYFKSAEEVEDAHGDAIAIAVKRDVVASSLQDVADGQLAKLLKGLMYGGGSRPDWKDEERPTTLRA